jgi:hypothetical protein
MFFLESICIALLHRFKTYTQTNGTQSTSTQFIGMSQKDWEKLDRRARSTIRLCLDDSMLLNVSG